MAATSPIACTVYGLASSADHKIRYIGQTVTSLQSRLNSHISEARKKRKNYRHHWINSVLASGHDVIVVVIKKNATLHVDEISAIRHYRSLGFDLVNLTSGGEGSPGCVHSKETRAKFSARLKGNQYGCGNKGRKFTVEHRAKMSANLIGNKRSAGHPAWNKGRPMPAHVRLALNAATSAKFKGSGNPQAKLIEQEVIEIRKLLAAGMSQSQIARLYNVRQQQVCRIALEIQWGHLEVDPTERATIKAAAAAHMSGIGHPRAVLSEQDVEDIRMQLAKGKRVALIAERYGVSTVQIYRIKNGTRRAASSTRRTADGDGRHELAERAI